MNPIQKQLICSICLDEVLPPLQKVDTRCGHTFHKTCLDTWKRYGDYTCPECRSDLKGRDIQQIKIEFDPNSLDSLLSAREKVLKYHRTCNSQINRNLIKQLDKLIDEKKAQERKSALICFVAYSVIVPLFLRAMYHRRKEINEIQRFNNRCFDKLEKGPLINILNQKRIISDWPFSWEKYCHLDRLNAILIKRPLSEALSLKEELLKYKPDAMLDFFLKELDEIIKKNGLLKKQILKP